VKEQTLKHVSMYFSKATAQQHKRSVTKVSRLQRNAIQWFSGGLTAALIVSGVCPIEARELKSNSVQQGTTNQAGKEFAPHKISRSDLSAKKKVLGTWRLLSWSNKDPQGNLSYPYGKDALGYIVYNPDGYMCATLSKKDRPNFPSGDILGGTLQEQAQAVQTYIAYCGTYTVTGTTVTHHVKVSLFPNYIGTDQVRMYKFENGKLVLSHAPEMMDGKLQTPAIVWERASK